MTNAGAECHSPFLSVASQPHGGVVVTIAHNLTLVFFSYHNNLFDLTTAHVLLDFNSAQRKEFWSVRRLVCYNNTPDSLCTDLKFALRKGRWVLNNVIQVNLRQLPLE